MSRMRTVSEARAELIAALDELNDWIAGSATFHNRLHGSVTGDYEHQEINIANADNAQKIALAAKVNALTVLVASEGVNHA